MRRAFTLQMHDAPDFKGWLLWCDHCAAFSNGDVYETEERAIAVAKAHWCSKCHSELEAMEEP